MAIGIWSVALQPVRAQSTASDLFRVAPRDPGYGKWLTESFLAGANGWRGIWHRSLAMGASLTSFLDKELDRDKDREHRWVLTGAYSLAARNPHTVFAGKKFSDRTRYRFMVLFSLALGARHERGSAAFLHWIEWKRLSELERIAACLALARIDDREALPKSFTEMTKSPGVLAAALYCRPDRRVAWVEHRVKRLDHRDLVWRGYLLGNPCSAPADRDRTRLALAVLAGDRGAPVAPREAAWYLAHTAAPASILDGLDLPALPLEQRLMLCHSKAFRVKLLAERSTPKATEDKTLQRRWFALYARWAPVTALRNALTDWKNSPVRGDVEVTRAIGLALAERLMWLPAVDVRTLGLDTAWLATTDVGPWLRLAAGETAASADISGEDTALRRALRLMMAGRLPRARAAAALRLASWRDGPDGRESVGGSNPALTGLALHRQLLGELLIDGSGQNFVASGRKPYKAAGLGRTDPVLEVATELFKFIRREEPWSAREYRLPN